MLICVPLDNSIDLYTVNVYVWRKLYQERVYLSIEFLQFGYRWSYESACCTDKLPYRSNAQYSICQLIQLIYRIIYPTRDLKGLKVDLPCDNLFQTGLIYKIHFLILNGASHPIQSKIRLMDKIPCVYSDPYTHSHSEFAQCILL